MIGPFVRYIGATTLTALSYAGLITALSASPSTADFMNSSATCGLGLTISIDANLAGSMKTIYDGAETKGKGYLSIQTALRELVAASQPGVGSVLIDKYLTCIETTLALQP